MADPILWADATGVVFRVGMNDEPPPAAFAESMEFDLATNTALYADICNTFDTTVWHLAAGVLSKDGAPQTVNGYQLDNQDRRDFSKGLQQALIDLQTISTATFITNVQRDAAVHRLAQIERVMLRRLALLVR